MSRKAIVLTCLGFTMGFTVYCALQVWINLYQAHAAQDLAVFHAQVSLALTQAQCR